MYKIYINETPLFLISQKELSHWKPADAENMVARYTGKPKFLMAYIDMLEKSRRFQSVTLYADDLEQLKADFDSHFTILEAAGGLVLNPEHKILFIYRRNSWDLPKGKIDEGESARDAAIREVQEETGLKEVFIVRPLFPTLHIYREKKERILKRTFWFEMETFELDLVPQTEEDIDHAVWMDIETFRAEPRKVYGNINDLLNFWAADNKT